MTPPFDDQHAASSANPTLVVVVVNWNTGAQIRECLQSITTTLRNGFVLDQVIVVDNASSDGSADGLAGMNLPLVIVRNRTNRGFAAACNQAARMSGAQYILFLNPDTRLLAQSLSTPIKFLQGPDNEQIGIVGIQLLDDQGVVTPTCARFLTPGMVLRKMIGLEHLPRSMWASHFMAEWDHRTSRTVDHVMGAFFLVRKALFARLGGFDERFFVYLEDLDFSLRAKQAGFDSHYLADAQMYHKGGGATSQIRARSLYYALSSRILYCYKHFHRWTATALTLGTLFVEPFARIAFAAVRGSRSQVMQTIRAYAMIWEALPRRFADDRSEDGS